MYQTLTPCGAKVARFPVVSWTRTGVPGGARRVQLKLKLPKVVSNAERLGWQREDCIRFNMISHCGNSPSHSWIGKFGSSVAIPARK